MKLSVVIACFNAADTISTQLESLTRQCWPEPWEVIISDNGSTDESLTIVERYRERLPNLHVVDSSSRRGPGHARNIGVAAAVGDAILFCDADDEVAPGWLVTMGKALADHDFVACLLEEKKLNAPWQQQSWKNSQRDGLLNFSPPYLPFAAGTSIGVKRSLHEAVAGFDESLHYLDDIDYCWKIQLTGTKLQLVPDTVVHYRYRNTLRGIYRQSRLFAADTVLLYKRYRYGPLGGMPNISRSWKTCGLAWKGLLRNLPQIRHKAGRAIWVRQFGTLVGRLQGSIKHQVLFL